MYVISKIKKEAFPFTLLFESLCPLLNSNKNLQENIFANLLE